MTVAIVPQMTECEVAELATHEQVIEGGLRQFQEVGLAFLSIREAQLYRATHSSFEDYCEGRWGITFRRVQQLVASARVIKNLEGEIVSPMYERQAAPLATLPAEQQREAWQVAVETAPAGRITAAHVAAVVEHIRQPDKLAVHHSSATPEHYTPAHIIAAVVDFFDTIDLDPCAEEGDPKTVPARVHYTAANDGLALPWFGRVYMNPPYGRAIDGWVERLVAAYDSGEIEAGIALVPARTDTVWFRRLRDFPRCFVNGRLTFVGNEDSAPFPSVLVHVGDETDRFARAVAHLGDVYTRFNVEG